MDEDKLREAVSVLERSGSPLHAMFDMNLKLWHDTENRWPQMNDGGLNRPVPERLNAVVRAASGLVWDERMTSLMGPSPHAAMEADEIAVDEPALDQRCREIVSPKPLGPDIVAEMLKQGFKRDEIPEIDVTLSNIVVTRSDRLGYVWRADVHDNHMPAHEGMSRAVCWRRTSGEQPAVTWRPLPDLRR